MVWNGWLINVDPVFPVVKDIGVSIEKDVAYAIVIEHRDVLHGFRYLPLGERYFDLCVRKPLLMSGVIVEIAEIASLKHFGNPRLACYLLCDGNPCCYAGIQW